MFGHLDIWVVSTLFTYYEQCYYEHSYTNFGENLDYDSTRVGSKDPRHWYLLKVPPDSSNV